MASFAGTITTTGKSEAIRLDKSLFRLHPEFRQKAKVRAQVIAPGHALISVIDDAAERSSGDDPIVFAYLALLEDDMTRHPKRKPGVSKRDVARGMRLTKKVRVDDSERLPKSVTF